MQISARAPLLASLIFAAALAMPAAPSRAVEDQPFLSVAAAAPMLAWPAPDMTRAEAASIFPTLFDCTGEIMHRSYQGALQSPLAFWFGVTADGVVHGAVTKIGAPLDLPPHMITGRLKPEIATDGRFVGGRLTLYWPNTNGGAPVQVALMRETFVRVGVPVNGVRKIRRRTSEHTYAAGTMHIDQMAFADHVGRFRVSFLSATCFPPKGLAALAMAQ